MNATELDDISRLYSVTRAQIYIDVPRPNIDARAQIYRRARPNIYRRARPCRYNISRRVYSMRALPVAPRCHRLYKSVPRPPWLLVVNQGSLTIKASP